MGTSILKEFGPEGFKVTEKVAKDPSLGRFSASNGGKGDVFCLRIDADEYTEDSFRSYYPVFTKYKDALTIFFNIFSFGRAKNEILKCRDLGADVQSHAFYHYTYGDYENNRHNIAKAKDFFEGIGIKTKGFAAPYGRWNASLTKALEDEGYEYSSDFSYDYMGFPSYPMVDGKKSNVMQIPIFPVAPELFFRDDRLEMDIALEYYKRAVDEMIKRSLPVIIYGHTDPKMKEIPLLLEKIANYAVGEKALRPVSMTAIYEKSRGKAAAGWPAQCAVAGDILPEEFFGRKIKRSVIGVLKDTVKTAIDFERVTPDRELKGAPVKRAIKILARTIAKRN